MSSRLETSSQTTVGVTVKVKYTQLMGTRSVNGEDIDSGVLIGDKNLVRKASLVSSGPDVEVEVKHPVLCGLLSLVKVESKKFPRNDPLPSMFFDWTPTLSLISV